MELNIEYLDISQLRPYEKNARKHAKKDIATIKASITNFGMLDPIGIWSDKNIIVEGHGRWMACKELGMKKVPVIRLDSLTDEQRKAYALAHNKTAEMSEWDDEMLALELSDISLDMEQFGFDNPSEEKEVIEDDFDVEKNLPKEPKAKLGDIYILGDHILMCGDSTKLEDVENLVGGGRNRPSNH